jgi:uncharacterized protein involved in propanediol utilization
MPSEERRTGTATAPVHHGEILQGAFITDGDFRKGLVTLPCDIYIARAHYTVTAEDAIIVSPGWKSKAKRAAELAVAMLQQCGTVASGGYLELTSRVPLGQGFGSSTSDVLAAIRAVADAFSAKLPTAAVAKLAVEAEEASDSLMFEDSSVLFAHRHGEVIEDFGGCLPRVWVVGFVARPHNRTVDTLELSPARYSQHEIEIFCELRSELREAIVKNNTELLGKVATASTEINQRYLPIPELSKIKAIGRAVGSLGVQVAHSGSIAGLLFDPEDRDAVQRMNLSRTMLEEVGFREQWKFYSGAQRKASEAARDLQLDSRGYGTAQDHKTERQLVRSSVPSYEDFACSSYDRTS